MIAVRALVHPSYYLQKASSSTAQEETLRLHLHVHDLVGVRAVVVQEHLVHDHHQRKYESLVHARENGHSKCVLVQDRRRERDLPCHLQKSQHPY